MLRLCRNHCVDTLGSRTCVQSNLGQVGLTTWRQGWQGECRPQPKCPGRTSDDDHDLVPAALGSGDGPRTSVLSLGGGGGGAQGPWWCLVWTASEVLEGGTWVVIQTLCNLSLSETRLCVGLGPPRGRSVLFGEDAPVPAVGGVGVGPPLLMSGPQAC